MNHRHAWDLIPWYINGSLDEAGRGGLQRHLEECADCRAELTAQRAILHAMQTRPLVENMPHGSLQKLWARIDAEPAPAAPRKIARGAGPSRLAGWLTAAVVVQALLLGALSVALLKSPRDGAGAAPFRTVSTPAPAPGVPGIRAVFAPDMTLGELQALLERAHLHIVNGPSPEGVYTLATATAHEDAKQALLVLRAHPAARFAEPIGP